MKKVAALVAVATLVSSPAAAYEQEVHKMMTKYAVETSTLKDRMKDYGLSQGLLTVDSSLANGYLFYWFGQPILTLGSKSVVEWTQKGANDEDSIIGLRMTNHFYNPQALFGNEGLVAYLGQPSLDWGLGQRTPESVNQDFSLRKAKDYLYKGITEPSESERLKNLTQLFLTIGHVVHLVQDLGQPQHTRNDAHPPWNSSLYEAWTHKYMESLSYVGYIAPQFSLPQRYWTLCDRNTSIEDHHCPMGTGLADYSNRGFVTAGTNFTTPGPDDRWLGPAPGFPAPSGLGAEIDKVQLTDLTVPCLGVEAPDSSLKGELWLIKTPVPDFNDATKSGHAWTSTFSLFDADLKKKGASQIFTFNRCNAQSIQELLVPRAVAYSKGLINHFFRAKLEISPPKVGPYAYADHATATGFSSIRATIKNATPNETLKGGKFVAVVKFRRNTCYKPDLSGEFTAADNGNPLPPAGCSYPDYRMGPERVVISDEWVVNLQSDASTELTFTFNEEIPMNATDVYMQVVYRGRIGLGADASEQDEDGIAVGARDLSEPTFFTFSNSTDLFSIPHDGKPELFYWKYIRDNVKDPPYSIVDSNKNQTYDGPPGDIDIYGAPIHCTMYVNGAKVARTLTALPEGRFSRLALLVEPGTFPLDLVTILKGRTTVYKYFVRGRMAQLDHAESKYVVSTVHEYRGTKQFSSVWINQYHGTPPRGDSPGQDLPSKEEKGTQPFELLLEPPAGPTLLERMDLSRSAAEPPDGTAAAARIQAPPRLLLMNPSPR
jgi:hypothetical protein